MIDEDLHRITQEGKPTISEILQCSPFDTNKNIGGLLTEKLFFDHLFASSASFDDLTRQMLDALNPNLENIRLLILDGFSGTGKTTFVRHFIQSPLSINSIYIDFNAYARVVDNVAAGEHLRIANAIDLLEERVTPSKDAEESPSLTDEFARLKALISAAGLTTNPIESAMKGFMERTDGTALADCLYFIYSKMKSMSVYFSRNFIDQTRIIDRRDILDKSYLLINSCDFSDIFLLFFVWCFRALPSEKTTLVFFDNLDAINWSYLSDYFKQSFARVLSNATAMAQDPAVFDRSIDFVRRYKFIFCLRDANSASLNSHIADSLGHTSRVVHFKLSFDGDLYKRIIDKDFDFSPESAKGKIPRAPWLLP